MSWTDFHYEDPDFVVRSVLDNTTFTVKRAALESSQVFRDMFSCCEPDIATADDDQVLDLHETTGVLGALLRLLHFPPALPVSVPSSDDGNLGQFKMRVLHKKYIPASVIPLPLLPLLFQLADKYALSDSVTSSLHAHLLAHAPTDGLAVYGFATLHGMDTVASEASQYLLPMSSYRTDEVKAIPSVEAYHKVIRLQNLRVNALRDLILKEEIFPHGYGMCPSHQHKTVALWNEMRKALAVNIESGTDVAGEMAVIMDALQNCKVCHKAGTAAVEMLAYKSLKIPRQIRHLPAET